MRGRWRRKNWHVLSRWDTTKDGADQNITPREVIRDLIEFLELLCQNLAVATDELLQGDFLLPDPSLPTPVICSMMNVGYNNVPASGVESEIGPSMF